VRDRRPENIGEPAAVPIDVKGRESRRRNRISIEAKIKNQNRADHVEGQLDKPEQAAIVSPARFCKSPTLSNASSESSSLRICSSAKSSPKLLTSMTLTSSFASVAPVKIMDEE
jgi:hypothetical protein